MKNYFTPKISSRSLRCFVCFASLLERRERRENAKFTWCYSWKV